MGQKGRIRFAAERQAVFSGGKAATLGSGGRRQKRWLFSVASESAISAPGNWATGDPMTLFRLRR